MIDQPSDKNISTASEKVQEILKKADDHYRQGHNLRAIWNYSKVLKLDPDNITALVNLGLIYSTTKGKGHKALDLIKKAQQLDPENPTILFNLSTLTAHTGDIKEAMSLLEEVERINPNYADLHYNKAYLLTHLEDWDGAKEEVEKELKNNPSNFNALVMKEALQHREEQNNQN